MISAAWGVFVWHEFSAAPRRARRFLFWMFARFLLGWLLSPGLRFL
jgi:glucose uptake protein